MLPTAPMPHADKTKREVRVRKRLAVEFGAAYPLRGSGFTVNVSPHGMRIASQSLQAIGAMLHLQVRLPDGGKCQLEGRVVWAQKGSQALQIPSTMGLLLRGGDEAWFKLVAEAAQIDTHGPATPAPAPSTPRASNPPTPAKITRPIAPPTPPPSRPVLPTSGWKPQSSTRDVPTTPKVEPPRTAPTLDDLRARPRIDRATRYPDRLNVFFGSVGKPDLRGVSIDVSLGGIAIETLSLRGVGTPLQLEIELPDGDIAHCSGLVVRTRGFDLLQRTQNSMAVRFTDVDAAWHEYLGRRSR